MPQLNHTIGDNKTFEIPLRWEGRNFTPGEEWNLLWTLYSDADDPEGSILRQKETGLGIVHSGNDALITLIPQDTLGDAEADPEIDPIPAGAYFWAVLAVRISDGHRRHVADGTYVLKAASTSLSTPSVPIYTSTPPSPNSVLGAFSASSAADPAEGTDEVIIRRSGGLLRATLTVFRNFLASFFVRFDTAQTLTAPEQAQARENIGLADDDGNIPEELFPDIITVDGVTMADGSGVELPDGTLALDGSTPPKLMIHDGETTGGIPAEGWIMRGAGSLNLATDNVATEKVITLADLVLPLGFIPDTTGVEKIFIQGQVAIHANSITNYNPSIDPRVLFYFVEAPGASGSPRGIGAVIGTGGISDSYIGFDINGNCSLSYTSGGTARINTGETPTGQGRKRSITSGNITTDSLSTLSLYGSSLQYTAPATGPVTLRCAIILPPDAATANATGYIRAACNLRLHFA